MPLNHRAKQRFFDSLARLIRTGITLPAALDKLIGPADGKLRPVMQSMRTALAKGSTVAEALNAQQRELGLMEASVLGAAERTGKMDQVLHQLADYHGALAEARQQVRTKMLYPAFVFHIGVLLLSIPRLLPKSELADEPAGMQHGLIPYLWATFGMFAAIYAGIIVFLAVIRALGRIASRDALVDGALNKIPVVGNVRRSFACSRFCMTYELHLSAGVNAIDALQTAAEASQSGIVRRAVARALPEVRAGKQVGASLASDGSLPGELIEGLLVGEETGQLDQTLPRLADSYRRDAINALQTLADWIPRLIYVGILIFLAIKVIQTFQQIYFGPIRKLMDFSV